MYNELAVKKKERKIVTVFSRSGTVFAVVNQGKRPRPVRSDEALQRLLSLLNEASATTSAGEPSHNVAAATRVTDEGRPTRQLDSTSPTSRGAVTDSPNSSGATMETDMPQNDHLVAGRSTRAGGAARAQSLPFEGTPVTTSTDSITVLEEDDRPGNIAAGADRPSRPDPRPVTQERAGSGGGRDATREPERRPATGMYRRQGGGPSAGLRRRQGADIRQFLGAVPRVHSKCD